MAFVVDWANFRPLVAGGADPLSALAAQRMGYDTMNVNTATADIARANAAQELAGRYLSDINAAQERSLGRALSMQQAANEQANRIALYNKQLRNEAQQFREQMRIRREGIAQEDRKLQASLDLAKAEEERQRNLIRQTGESLKGPLFDAGKAFDTAQEIFTKQQARINQLLADLQSELPPNTYDERSGSFVLPPKVQIKEGTPFNAATWKKMQSANEQLRNALAILESHAAEVRRREAALNELRAQQRSGLIPIQRNGAWGFSAPTLGEEYFAPPPQPPHYVPEPVSPPTTSLGASKMSPPVAIRPARTPPAATAAGPATGWLMPPPSAPTIDQLADRYNFAPEGASSQFDIDNYNFQEF